ncbi:MAG: D-2-hydroxyacid dehydrogenase [Acidobacteria bacterium]|nr:D-2-hydroxyacid dehydrogenase [Acidobacteriota bacterium]
MEQPPKIVILDGHTVNPGDLSWAPFEQLGDLTVYPRTAAADTYERSREAEIIITSKVVLDRAMLDRLPRLRYIGVIATGYNVVDLAAARERDIPVTNVPDYCTESVAQLVMAHLLELARRIGAHNRSVRNGDWSRAKDFCYWIHPQVELTGKTLGLIGYGHIGGEVARLARAFGMRIIAFDIYPKDEDGVDFVSLERVFTDSDVVSLHCPLTDENRGLINTVNLRKMKPTAFLINTSRGPLVNDRDLAAALAEGVIAGAGLDVLSTEPPPEDNPLLDAPNCHITPHVAWASEEARLRLIRLTAENVESFLKGKPINVVN